jgi:hypothetical protein
MLRTLQVTFESRRDHWSLETDMGADPSVRFGQGVPAFDDVMDKLGARPGLASARIRPPSITERLKIAEQYVTRHTPDQRSILTYWRIASAINHGRRETTWAITDAIADEALTHGFRATMSSNVAFVIEILEAANGYTGDALDLLESRN